MYVVKRDGRKEPVQFDKITARIEKLCYGLDENFIEPILIAQKVVNDLRKSFGERVKATELLRISGLEERQRHILRIADGSTVENTKGVAEVDRQDGITEGSRHSRIGSQHLCCTTKGANHCVTGFKTVAVTRV